MNNKLGINTGGKIKKDVLRFTFYVPRSTKTGFTLIFAILVGALLVAIGVSISNFTLKQLEISAVSRESQIAFYAADSGVECALYWDIQGPYLTSSTNPQGPFYFASQDHSSITGNMNCGASIDAGSLTSSQHIINGGVDYYQNNFIVHFGNPSPCAVVSLKKYVNGDNVVDSFGINDCSNTNNKFRVERAIQVQYK